MSTAPPAIAVRSVAVGPALQQRLVRAWLWRRAPQSLAITVLAAVAGVGVVSFDDVDVAGLPLIVIAVAVGSLVGERRRARSRYRLGTEIAFGVDGEVMRVTADGVDRLVHLSRVVLRGVRGDVVRLRAVSGTVLVPSEIVDDVALAALRTGAVAPTPDGGVLRWVGHLPVGEVRSEDVADLRRLTWRRHGFRPLSVAAVLLVVAFALSAVVLDHVRLGLFLLLVAFVVVLDPLLEVVRARTGIPAAGSVLVGDVERDLWVAATSTVLTAVPMSFLASADRYRGLVRLRWDRPVPETSFPVRLLSSQARARFLGSA